MQALRSELHGTPTATTGNLISRANRLANMKFAPPTDLHSCGYCAHYTHTTCHSLRNYNEDVDRALDISHLTLQIQNIERQHTVLTGLHRNRS